MFSSIGLPELLVIMVIVLLLFGSRRLPELGSSLGKAIGEFKRGLQGEPAKAELNPPLPPIPEPADKTAPQQEKAG
jgi:sec-independent protein translocase protein TatA